MTGLITAKQLRAARALLACSQSELALKAGVATSTIADFERGVRSPIANNLEAIRKALEGEGVRFPPGGAIEGPPLRPFGQPTSSGSPIRWVNATDLEQWAQRRDSQGAFPALVGKLVRATGVELLRIPSDEAVQLAGWDGITRGEVRSDYVPIGMAGWEFGTQRARITQKADKDYAKRTASPGELNPAESTYVFATLGPWPGKDKWAAKKLEEGIWHDVKAYDGTDFVHWIELHPAIGQELAVALNKRPPGTRQLQDLWEEWSLATSLPLPTDVCLADRDQQVSHFLKWLREEPSVLALQGETAEEVAAFAFAAIQELPARVAEYYLVRTLVADTPSMARALADSHTRLLIVLLDAEPGLAETIARKGHHVLNASSGFLNDVDGVEALARPSVEGIRHALTSAGLPDGRAQSLARESARSLAILRRLMPARTARLPSWAVGKPSAALLAALMAGAWDEESKLDQAILADLANQPYEAVVVELTPFAGRFDAPLRKVGSTWKIASPQDAWTLLAPYLSSVDVERFETAAIKVFSFRDPRFDLTAEQRFMVSGDREGRYSQYLRRGMGEMLTMLGLFGQRVRTVVQADRRAAYVVRKILEDADGPRWWSLADNLQHLSEAAPPEFLDAIRHNLDMPEPSIATLFIADPNAGFGREYLTHLLWALESLAWSAPQLGRVGPILAQLDDMDPGSRHGNRPYESLRTIFNLWLPQTSATLDERLRVLDRIRKDHPEAAWRLMLRLLPTGHDVVIPSATPRWRDPPQARPELAALPLIQRGTRAIGERLLSDAGINPLRWGELIKHLSHFPDRPELIRQFNQSLPAIAESSARHALYKVVRQTLHNHRAYPDATWTIADPDLTELDKALEALASTEADGRIRLLFEQGAILPQPRLGWEQERDQLKEVRAQAIASYIQDHGVESLLALVESVDDPMQLGISLVEAGVAPPSLDSVVARALKAATEKSSRFAHGMIALMFRLSNQAWLENLFLLTRREGWGDRALLTILGATPIDSNNWALAKTAGASLEQSHWRAMPLHAIKADDSQIAFVVEKLLSVERVLEVVEFIGYRVADRLDVRETNIPSKLLVDVLKLAAKQSWDDQGGKSDLTMRQYYVVEILKRLDKADDVPESDMLFLEWAYLPLLEYSQRPARVFMNALARNPELFVELICVIFNPAPGSGVTDDPSEHPERAQALAGHAFELLRQWKVLPGTTSQGAIEAEALKEWVKVARELSRRKGRAEPADRQIGEILSASPIGDDGIWPALPIREIIESTPSADLEEGMWIGKLNRRGVTTRLPHTGGQPERSEADQFQRFAGATAFDWPRTSVILNKIAMSFRQDAQHHDGMAEEVDW